MHDVGQDTNQHKTVKPGAQGKAEWERLPQVCAQVALKLPRMPSS